MDSRPIANHRCHGHNGLTCCPDRSLQQACHANASTRHCWPQWPVGYAKHSDWLRIDRFHAVMVLMDLKEAARGSVWRMRRDNVDGSCKLSIVGLPVRIFLDVSVEMSDTVEDPREPPSLDPFGPSSRPRQQVAARPHRAVG